MKTEIHLQDAIQRDLSWRKREIYTLKISARTSSESFIFRGGLILLCAHWEGFLKKATNAYIKHVLSQDIEITKLKPSFLSILIYSDTSKAAEAEYPGSQDHHIKLSKNIKNCILNGTKSQQWKAETEGNPSSEVVIRLMRSIGLNEKLGLDDASWIATKTFIDEQIVRDRNFIAHGAGLPIKRDELIYRIDKTVELFELLTIFLVDSARNKNYIDPIE